MPVTTDRAPKFSILLPTHNRADVLPFAIQSVLEQTVQDFELLIVGDGCTDNTAAVVSNVADPRICWFDLPKAPHFGYANRNIALRQARGAHIAFMTHDDLWLPDHLEQLGALLEETQSELVYSRPVWVAPDGTMSPTTYNLHNKVSRDLFLSRQLNEIPSSCVLHRQDCFDKYGYWDETLPGGGDWDMWVRIIEGGKQQNFAYLELPTCLHFRAIWRTEANAGPPELKIWKELHALEDFNPPALRISVPTGATEQETFWQAIKANPTGWTKELRVAVHQVLDQRIFQSDQLLLKVSERSKSTGGEGIAQQSLVTSIVAVEFEKSQLLETETQRLTTNLEEVKRFVQLKEDEYGKLRDVYDETIDYARSLESSIQQQDTALANLQLELDAIYGSRAWQLARKIQQFYRWFRR